MNNFGDIVVGYDGSKGAKRAVEFAAAEAAAHQARLQIISVWNSRPPAAASVSSAVAAALLAERPQLAAEQLEEAAALAREAAPDVELHTVAVEGSAAAELERSSGNSRLLVVGSRGGIHGYLGSVSHHCALHARCPVLIIPSLVDDRPPVHHRPE